MKEIFKQLIVDFHEEKIPLPSPREMAPLVVPKGLKKAFVLVGMRRSGKTWSLYQQMHIMMEQGIDQTQLLYLNFEDDRLADITLGDMQSVLDAYFELYPEYIENNSLHFFFDEIHEVEGWERFVRRLLDKENIQIYLTGSSAKLLSKEIATSLRGRTLLREVFPYSFREFLTHKEIEFQGKRSTSKQQSLLKHEALAFLVWGGFPETISLEKSLHREILQGYVDTVIYRDIVERYRISNVHALRRLLVHCLQNPASSFSVNKMYHTLKSGGYAVSKNTLYAFMNYLEDAYCIFSIPAFHFSLKKATLKPKKIYPVDQGLITAYAIDGDYYQGIALETTIFSSLIRRSKQIFYFQTQKNLEVDFFVFFPDNSKHLIQVSWSLREEKARKREINALCAAMEETNLKVGHIVTLDESESIHVAQGIIHVHTLKDFLEDERESIRK